MKAFIPLWCTFIMYYCLHLTTSQNVDISTGTQQVSIGVGCEADIEYPQSLDNSTSPKYSYKIDNPLAEFISLHFVNFNLPPNDYVVIRSLASDATQEDQIIYHGNEVNRNSFFSSAIYATKVVLELYLGGEDRSSTSPFLCLGFKINFYRYLAIAGSNKLSGREKVCGADDSKEASCYRSSPIAFQRSGAVARLLIHKPNGSFFCTGWLVGCEGHLLTNHHCISTQEHASSTQFEFMAQADTCSTTCRSPMNCRGSVRARSAILISADQALDYALVKLEINVSQDYGYLQMRASGAVLSERIYVPQHPLGWGKQIAMKDGGSWGVVSSLSQGGCAPDQVAYNLDTYAGSSGSPVIGWSDNAVVALHHCGGCPNTAININKIINHFNQLNIMPRCAVYSPPTSPPPLTTTRPPPTTTRPPPTTTRPPPTTTQPPPTTTRLPPTTTQPPPTTTSPPVIASHPPISSMLKTIVDGTITSTRSVTSVDYVDLELPQDAVVEFDILSYEKGADGNFYDINGDCNAGYIDSSIILFQIPSSGQITSADAIAVNDNAPAGYGSNDGSISDLDAYIYLPLSRGRYRIAIGASPLSIEMAVGKLSSRSSTPSVCTNPETHYGNYRLTISAAIYVTVTNPNSYIGSQCNVPSPTTPYPQCMYHKEHEETHTTLIDGSIRREDGFTTVDIISFTIPTFQRVNIEVSSYQSVDGYTFYNVNGYCDNAYIDPIVYLFRKESAQTSLTPADMLQSGDDDEAFMQHTSRHSISFRDPYFTAELPPGDYILAIGRYPMTINNAIEGKNLESPEKYTPSSCGTITSIGHYMVTMKSGIELLLTSPSSFVGAKCPSEIGKLLCSV